MRQSATTWDDQTFRIHGQNATISWSPRTGLCLRISGTDYSDSKSQDAFPQDRDGNVSELDVRRARDEMIVRAHRNFHRGRN